MAITNQRNNVSGAKIALGIAQESSYGVAVAPTSYVQVSNHNIQPSNAIIMNPVARKSIGNSPVGFGNLKVGGSITSLLDADYAPQLFVAALGLDTIASSGASATIHTLTPQYPKSSYTLTADDGNGVTKSFTGCKFNKLSLSCKGPNGFLEAKIDVIGQSFSTTNASLSPQFSLKDEFQFGHLSAGGCILNGSTVLNIQDLQIDLDNKMQAQTGSIGGRLATAINDGPFVVTGSFSAPYDSVIGEVLAQALYGASNGPAPGKIPTQALTLTFVQPASGGFAPSLSLVMPAVTFQDLGLTRDKNNFLVQQVKFTAQESTPGAQNDLSVVILNSVSTAFS